VVGSVAEATSASLCSIVGICDGFVVLSMSCDIGPFVGFGALEVSVEGCVPKEKEPRTTSASLVDKK
jgi:hypothetical protein